MTAPLQSPDQGKPTDSHEEKKVQLRREIEIAELNLQLETLKGSPVFRKQVSTREKLEKSFSEHDAHVMGAKILAKQKREEYAKKLQDNPELLRDSEESIQHWLEKQTLE